MPDEQPPLTPEEEFRRLRKAFDTDRDALNATERERLFELVNKLGIAKASKIIRDMQIEVEQEKLKRRL